MTARLSDLADQLKDQVETLLRDADAVIQRLNSGAELQSIMAAHNDTLAKLREAVEVMGAMREQTAAVLERYDDHEQSNHPHVYVLLKRIDAFLATMEKQEDSTSE